jgi:hypothetical protein
MRLKARGEPHLRAWPKGPFSSVPRPAPRAGELAAQFSAERLRRDGGRAVWTEARSPRSEAGSVPPARDVPCNRPPGPGWHGSLSEHPVSVERVEGTVLALQLDPGVEEGRKGLVVPADGASAAAFSPANTPVATPAPSPIRTWRENVTTQGTPGRPRGMRPGHAGRPRPGPPSRTPPRAAVRRRRRCPSGPAASSGCRRR